MINSYNTISKLGKNIDKFEKYNQKVLGVVSLIQKQKLSWFSFNKNTMSYYKLNKKLYLDNSIKNPFLCYTKKFLPGENLIIYGIKFENDLLIDENIQTYKVILPVLIELKEKSALREILPKD